MANLTATEIRDAVLERLNVKPVNGPGLARDANKMTRVYTARHAYLRTRGLAPFDKNSVPEDYQEPLINYLVGEAAEEFQFTGPMLQEKLGTGFRGSKELQALSGNKVQGTTRYNDF